jgi:hypothetical protein
MLPSVTLASEESFFKKIKLFLLTMKIALNSLEEAYAWGVLFAARHFIDTNPDWYNRIGEGAFYSLAWPYKIACIIEEYMK